MPREIAGKENRYRAIAYAFAAILAAASHLVPEVVMRRGIRTVLRVPILRGRLRGRWWLPAAGGKVLPVLFDLFERAQVALFARLVAPGAVVFDVGAHQGYYSLVASPLVGPRGRVYAFEPSPRNLLFLREQLRLNRCANVAVFEAAAANQGGERYFVPGRWPATGTGHLAGAGELLVQTVSLDEFVGEVGHPPDILKIDVEGAELLVLEGARETLRRDRPIIFLSTHGCEIKDACCALLQTLAYRTEPIGRSTDEVLCTPAELARQAAVEAAYMKELP